MADRAAFDVVVAGGGISGAAIAWALAEECSVVLLEREDELDRHTTGRSAATFVETLGDETIRGLTRAGRGFLEHPPESFGASPLAPMAVLEVARPEALDTLRRRHQELRVDLPDVELLTAEEVTAAHPYLRPGVFAGGLLEPRAGRLDVHALHQGFVRGLRERGGEVRRSCGLDHASYDGRVWTVGTTDGRRLRASYVVDAAGAWCDDVARRCGVAGIGISPRRRTVFTVAAPPAGPPTTGVPMVLDTQGTFYAKPEGDQFLCSPMDETPMEPGDPRPDVEAIALTLEILEEVTTLSARAVRTSWAGQRSFGPGGRPVVGFAPDHPGFFWYAGQGGVGVQTAPVLSTYGQAAFFNRALGPELTGFGLRSNVLSLRTP